jgi:hypothetical protein
MSSLFPDFAPQVVTFSGHETFVLRHGWLKKAYDAVLADDAVFTRQDAIVTLGVGKNMVRSIRHWAIATKVIEEIPKSRGTRFKPTALADFLFADEGGRDKYLEDINSLWILHWNLATNEERATTCAWAFSWLRSNEFTASTLKETIKDQLHRRNLAAANEDTLERDVDCFIRTYALSRVTKRTVLEDSLDSPFVELGLLQHDWRSGGLRFQRGSRTSIADEVFLYSLVAYWEATADRRESLSFNEIAFGPRSPGSVFKMDEESVIERLERLPEITKGRLLFSDTAGVKQVFKKAPVTRQESLGCYYNETAFVRM